MNGIVLLTDWGPSSLSFARSCHRQRIPVHLLQLDAATCQWTRYTSCLSGGDTFDRQHVRTPHGIRLIRSYAHAAKARALLATDEMVLLWLAHNRSAFEPDVKLLMPTADVLGPMRSKRNQIAVANRVGFDVLPTFYVHGARDRDLVPSTAYPVVARPDQKTGPGSPFKVRLLTHRAELESLANAWDASCGPLIVQPFRDLPNLVVHGVRTEAGTVLAMQPFLVPRKFQGVTLTITPTEFPPHVERGCRAFAEAAGITGCFHFELLRSLDGRRAWFLEMNPRLGGTTSKVARLGFDETSHLLAAYGLLSLPEPPPRVLRRMAGDRRALLKHLLWALRGDLTEFDHPPGTRWQRAALSFRDLWIVKDSIIDWRDLRGSFWRSPRRGVGP